MRIPSPFVLVTLALLTPAALAGDPAQDAPKPADAPTPAPAQAAGPERTLESGLVIEDLAEGTGAEIKPGAYVVMHYRGTLKATGEEFDSSYSRPDPLAAQLKAGRLIAGWVEGIPGMKVGGKRKLTIPAKMAYGEKGFTDRRTGKQIIPANSDLVFEVEALNTLVIEDLKVGDGAECTGVDQTVKVFYRGTRKVDGVEFDSNMGKEPIEFPLRSLIPGWQIGIPGMQVGGRRKLVIPWQWAYGARGSGDKIPPKTDLVFEIELLDVKSPAAPAAAPEPAPAAPTGAPASTGAPDQPK
jgi:peptidylprolyl isomerase